MIAAGLIVAAVALLMLPVIAPLIAKVQTDRAAEWQRLTAPLPPARAGLAAPLAAPPIIAGSPLQSPLNPAVAHPVAAMPTVLEYRPRHAAEPGEVTQQFDRIIRENYPGVEIVHIGHGEHADRSLLDELT